MMKRKWIQNRIIVKKLEIHICDLQRISDKILDTRKKFC